MARPRKDLGRHMDEEIAARTARGESAQTIHTAIRGALSVASLIRRQAELKQGVAPAPPAPTVAPQPIQTALPEDTIPEDLNEHTPLEDLSRWIQRLEMGARRAEQDGNLAALASIAAKVATLMALRHKASPLPKADPNENPDMIKLAALGEARLMQLANGLFPRPK